MLYKKIAITGYVSRGNVQIYYTKATNLDGDVTETKKIDVYLLKDIGVIKRIDHMNKAEAFLNTEEGNKLYQEANDLPVVWN